MFNDFIGIKISNKNKKFHRESIYTVVNQSGYNLAISRIDSDAECNQRRIASCIHILAIACKAASCLLAFG